tara:strand:+ start:5195 stop:5887 length:693 start_codon:yes stop_codon:yes gene_type:complete
MKVTIITSNNIRHKAFAKLVSEKIKVDFIIFESKDYNEESLYEKEKEYFPNAIDWNPKIKHIFCEKNEINEEKFIDLIERENPDLIFTFGCSLLKEDIFLIPEEGCINIHTGLVQYYRGVDSSFWALHEKKPDRIGATLHYIDNSIDGGGVINQKKTRLSVNDSLDDIFIKTCIAGFELLIESLNDIKEKSVKTKKLKKGKLFQIKDMNIDTKEKVQNRLKTILKKYLEK